MKKILSMVIALVLCMAMLCTLVACDTEKVQGVDTENHVITIGNTAATSGAFASVGVPFNYGLEASLWYFENYTDGYEDEDGNSYTFEFIHYDDGFDGTVGSTYTEKLVEDDQVFALVGHFGSNTVAATVDYIESVGIPMVYGVCGVEQLYQTESNIMTVQPIYNTEGKTMLASAVAPTTDGMGLGATKVGVISTTDEAGMAMLAGIQEEQANLGLVTGTDIFYYAVAADATDYTAAVNGLKSAGCDVVIIAAAQVAYVNIAQQFVTSSYDNVSVLTSYVSANYATQSGLAASGFITETRRSFAGAWLYTGSSPSDTKGWNDFAEYVEAITLYDIANGTALVEDTYGYFTGEDWAANGISSNYLNSYAMAGWVAGSTFTQGLERCSGSALTWDSYIEAMESDPIDVKMGLTIDYSDGQREGIAALALMEYEASTWYFGSLYRGLTDLPDIEASIK